MAEVSAVGQSETPTPGEYSRGVGSGEQLGYGEAGDLNAELAEGDRVEEQLDDSQLVDDEFDFEDSVEPDVAYDDTPSTRYKPANEFEEVMFGPPEGLAGPVAKPSRHPIPQSVIRALPQLAMAANDPSSPPAIRALYKYTVQRLEAEHKRDYR